MGKEKKTATGQGLMQIYFVNVQFFFLIQLWRHVEPQQFDNGSKQHVQHFGSTKSTKSAQQLHESLVAKRLRLS